MSKKENSSRSPEIMLDLFRFIKKKGYTCQYNVLNGYDVINRNGRVMSKSTVSKLLREFHNITTKNENK